MHFTNVRFQAKRCHSVKYFRDNPKYRFLYIHLKIFLNNTSISWHRVPQKLCRENPGCLDGKRPPRCLNVKPPSPPETSFKPHIPQNPKMSSPIFSQGPKFPACHIKERSAKQGRIEPSHIFSAYYYPTRVALFILVVHNLTVHPARGYASDLPYLRSYIFMEYGASTHSIVTSSDVIGFMLLL